MISNKRMPCHITDSDLQEPGDRLDDLEDLDKDLYEIRRQQEIDDERAERLNEALKDIGAVTLDELIDLSRLT